MANCVDQYQNAPIGAVCSGSTLFASMLNSSVMLGNNLQQTISADDIFRCIFFLGALRDIITWVYQFSILLVHILFMSSFTTILYLGLLCERNGQYLSVILKLMQTL